MPWSSIGTGGFEGFSDPVVLTDQRGYVEVYEGQPLGLYYVVANSPRGGWDADNWISIGAPTPVVTEGFGASQIAVGHEPDRGLVLFVSVESGEYLVYNAVQFGEGGPPWEFKDWTPIGSGFSGQVGTPVIGYDAHSAINVFVAAGSLLRSTETAAGSGQWSGWQNLGGNVPSAYLPAVGADWDGRLEVFVRDGADVQFNWQTTPGGEWHGWASLGAPGPGAASDVAVASDDVQAGSRAGCLEVVVVGSDQHLYQISQTAPGNGWGAWADLGGVDADFELAGLFGPVAARPVIGSNGDGCLEAYLVAAYPLPDDYTVYRIRQQSPGGAWSGWASLGGPGQALSSNPAVGRIIDNDLLQLFVLGADGNIYDLGQRRNSTW
jgi:hypothetical protein